MSSGRVYYGNVQPEWIGNTNSFLYENLTPSGTEYIIADAVKLTKRRAFNQEKFAASLKKTTGISFQKKDKNDYCW